MLHINEQAGLGMLGQADPTTNNATTQPNVPQNNQPQQPVVTKSDVGRASTISRIFQSVKHGLNEIKPGLGQRLTMEDPRQIPDPLDPKHGEKQPAMVMSFVHGSQIICDFAIFFAPGGFRVLGNIAGTKPLKQDVLGRKSQSRQGATKMGAERFGVDPSKFKFSILYNSPVTNIGGKAASKGSFQTIVGKSKNDKELVDFFTNFIGSMINQNTPSAEDGKTGNVPIPESTDIAEDVQERKAKRPNGAVITFVNKQIKLDPRMLPYRGLMSLKNTEIQYDGKDIPAVLLTIKKGQRTIQVAVFKVTGSLPYKAFIKATGAAMNDLGRKNISKSSATKAAEKEFGTNASHLKLSQEFGNQDDMGIDSGEAKFVGIPIHGDTLDSQGKEDGNFKKAIMGKILKALDANESSSVYGTHLGGKYLIEDADADLSIPSEFDYWGEGDGLYVAADTLYQNDYKGTLAEAIIDPEKLQGASWKQTRIEVIGPIPEGIEKLASPSHWKLVAATQANCREDALDKFVEAIGKTGCTANIKHGIIEVCNEAESIFDKNQMIIAKRTLRMSDAGAKVAGGMNKEEARAFLRKMGWLDDRIKKYEEDDHVDETLADGSKEQAAQLKVDESQKSDPEMEAYREAQKKRREIVLNNASKRVRGLSHEQEKVPEKTKKPMGWEIQVKDPKTGKWEWEGFHNSDDRDGALQSAIDAGFKEDQVKLVRRERKW